MSNIKTIILALALSLASTWAFTVTSPGKVGSTSSTALSYYGTVAPYRTGYGYNTADSYGYGNRGRNWNRYESDDMYGDYYSGSYNRRVSPYRNDNYGYGGGYGGGYGYGMDNRYGNGVNGRSYYNYGYDTSGRYPNERPRSYGYGRYGRYGGNSYGGSSIRNLERRLERAEGRAFGGYGRRSMGYGGNYRNTYSYADGYNGYGRDRYYNGSYGGYGGYGMNNNYNRYSGYGINNRYSGGYGRNYDRYSSYGRYY